MRHRLENAIDFFPLPVAQADLCPPYVSHFPFYGSPPSFLVEAPFLPAVGSPWRRTAGRQCWYGIRSTWLIQLPSSSLMGAALVQLSSSSLEMMLGHKKWKILCSVHWLLLIMIIASIFLGSEDFVHVHTSERVRDPSTFVCDSCSSGVQA